jgi:hypothetical protein
LFFFTKAFYPAFWALLLSSLLLCLPDFAEWILHLHIFVLTLKERRNENKTTQRINSPKMIDISTEFEFLAVNLFVNQ